MANAIRLFLSVIIFMGSYHSSFGAGMPAYALYSAVNDTASKPPEFRDGGAAVDGLKKTYRCTAIEFENWEEEDATDDVLTVCLVNCPQVGTGDPDRKHRAFVSVAAQIKRALKHPERYRSYYIIFVRREYQSGQTFSTHTAGATIPADGL